MGTYTSALALPVLGAGYVFPFSLKSVQRCTLLPRDSGLDVDARALPADYPVNAQTLRFVYCQLGTYPALACTDSRKSDLYLKSFRALD